MTYAKITSIGDMTPFGVPVTIEGKSGEHIVIMLEEEQCRYWCSRLNSIVDMLDKQGAAA